MAWRGFWFEVVIKDDERGLLMRSGRFEKLLEPGKSTIFDLFRELSGEVVKVVRAEIPAEKALLLARTNPELAAANFAVIQAGANEVALCSSTATRSTWCCQIPRGCSGRR